MKLIAWRRSKSELAYCFGYATDQGSVRQRNEDSVLAPMSLAIREGGIVLMSAIADGVGGLADGDMASGTALAAFAEAFHPESRAEVGSSLLLAAVAADGAVRNLNATRDDASQTGSTLVAAAICAGIVHVVHVGDSRAYLFRGAKLRALTRDHTIVADAVSSGTMSEQEAKGSPIRNVLTRGLGAGNGEAEVARLVRLRREDRVLLCSDGVHGVVPAAVMMHTLEREDDPQCAAERLIQHALDHGAPDNATAVVVRVVEGGQ